MAETDTPQRILEAADELFGRHGFEGVSVRDVAERADVNKALVFYHYDSKRRLFESVLDRYYERHRDVLKKSFEHGGEIRTSLHGVVDSYFDFICQNRRYPRLIQSLLAGTEDQVAFIRRSLEPLVQWTEEAFAELTPEEGPTAARHFFVTFSGAVIQYFSYREALQSSWPIEMDSDEALEERRQHLHWLADAIVDKLTNDE